MYICFLHYLGINQSKIPLRSRDMKKKKNCCSKVNCVNNNYKNYNMYLYYKCNFIFFMTFVFLFVTFCAIRLKKAESSQKFEKKNPIQQSALLFLAPDKAPQRRRPPSEKNFFFKMKSIIPRFLAHFAMSISIGSLRSKPCFQTGGPKSVLLKVHIFLLLRQYYIKYYYILLIPIVGFSNTSKSFLTRCIPQL